ncbi:MAG TPA: hypothetical protein VGW35_13775 [Methylomirabilota bacterium]|nr:hypothetical protein [Methylomirabilota bacterium]
MGSPAGSPGNLERFGRPATLGVALAFLVLAALYTLPLVAHLGDALPFAAVPSEGRETAWRIQGDYLQFYYYLWLVRDRVGAGASPLRDPYQFATDGPRLNLPNTFLPLALLYLPLSVPGPRLAYNLLVLLSFPLAGLAAALLAHRYGIGRWGALVAGAVFACAPYRLGALLGGHPAGLAYFLVPLALWGLEGALAGSVAGGVSCAIALLSLAIVEPHFFYFAALGLPLYLLARVGLAGFARDALGVGPGHWVLALAIAAAPAWGALALLRLQGWDPPAGARLAIGLVVALGALTVWQCAAGWLRASGVAPDGRLAARRSLHALLPWLATAGAGLGAGRGAKLALVALALPIVIHAGWLLRAGALWRVPILPLLVAGAGAGAGAGFLLALRGALLTRSVAGAGRSLHEVLLFSPVTADLFTRVNPTANRAIYPGALPVALALVGAVALARTPPEPRRRILWAFVPVAVLSGALSLGPRLTVVPLFEAAFHLVPFWNFVRQPAKFQVVASLALAILAAVAVEALGRQAARSWGRTALAAALALGIAAEYHPWRPAGLSLLPTAGSAYETIRTGGARALYLPLWPGDSSFSAIYLYTTTLTRVPMLNGYSAWIERSYVTDVYRALEALNIGVVGESEYATLRRLHVRQIIFDRDAFPMKVSAFGPAFTLANLRTSRFLELLAPAADGDPLWVFRVRERPGNGAAAAPRSPLGLFWEAESLPRETGVITIDPEASNGRVVLARAGRDRPGFVIFGPYRMLPVGPFRAVFRLRGHGSAAELQVTAASGQRVLGTRTVHPADTFEDVPVPFRLDEPASVEYRVKWAGAGWLAVDSVAGAFADLPDPAPVFEVQALGHELLERHDPESSEGVAGYADPRRTPRDRLWSGPLRGYPAGRYRLWVRVKLDRVGAAPFAWCGAQAASLGSIVGGRELLGAEVGDAGRYVELAVPFTLPRAAVLEFPCLYRGGTGVWFDRLRIEGPLPP